jgi:hypothetical protein
MTALYAAHLAIEQLTLDRDLVHLRDRLAPEVAEMVYYGFWFVPKMDALLAFSREAQQPVTGEVTLGLYKGNIFVRGRTSPNSLYDAAVASMEGGGSYEGQAAHRRHDLDEPAVRFVEVVSDDGFVVGNARRVREQVAQRDAAPRRGNAGDVFTETIVDRERATLLEFYDGHRGRVLRERTELEEIRATLRFGRGVGPIERGDERPLAIHAHANAFRPGRFGERRERRVEPHGR